MSGRGRKELLCEQATPELTGIDFIWVDPADHRRLAVFFVIGPDELVRPVNTAGTEFSATITGLEDASEIDVATTSWDVRLDAAGNPRLTLTVLAGEEGGFQTYRLALLDTPEDAGPGRLDRFCDALDFSFKQPCPSPFDCAPDKECPEEEARDYPVDYLARDFESLRQALLAYAADVHPDWEAQVPADFGGMVSELFAALGDEFSYIQDRFQREGYLETLTQRRSFQQLARLVDYRLDPGEAASGLVVMRHYPGLLRPTGLIAELAEVPSGMLIWADQDDRPAVPFETGDTIGEMIEGAPGFPVHSHWTDLPAYVPDPQTPCLPVGAREMYLADSGLLATPHPAEVLAADIGGYWVGRQVLIETRPVEPEAPVRRVLVTIDQPVAAFDDPLTGATGLLRLHWAEDDALSFELDQTQAFVSANLVPVRAGRRFVETFLTGESADPALAELPRSIERQGPARSEARPAIHRFTLGETIPSGLGWRSRTDASSAIEYLPDAALRQIDPDGGPPVDWAVGNDAMALAETDEAAVIEPGRWQPVARYERQGRRIVHTDYVGDPGYTLRFGDGVFGRQPVAGDLFEVTYRTGPGRTANVPADTITRIADAAEQQHILPPEVVSVTNPFALTGGRDPQSLETARRIAPAAYKALVYRAVRDQDYREQAERLDWVQEAGAATRWTGAWASTFVSADPKGAFEISEHRFAELTARLGAVRQVGRCVIARQPVFVPLDLKIAICIAAGFAFGDVAERVVAALSPRRGGGFFHPDRYSFGDPVRRPALEAAIGCVEGVAAVLEIRYRQRGRTGYRTFDVPELVLAADRIFKVENDPDRPGQGSIRIYHETISETEDA